jgi:hypothetical protein
MFSGMISIAEMATSKDKIAIHDTNCPHFQIIAANVKSTKNH